MSSDRRQPTARDRELAAQLKLIRVQQTTLTVEQAARVNKWSQATQSRTEAGLRPVTPELVAQMMTAYDVSAEQREEMIERARLGTGSGWWSRPLPGVLPDVGTLASFESTATALTDWSVAIVPGLLQTQEYAEALMLADGADPADVPMRWMARLNRQQVLRKVDYTAFIYETALRTPFGGLDALRGQLEHLHVSSKRGRSVRVVRERVAASALIHSWMLLEYEELDPILHVELQRSGVYLHDSAVSTYLEMRRELDHLALSATESRRMIVKLMEGI
jgi:hypothetical protein